MLLGMVAEAPAQDNAAGTSKGRPNIVLILADDLGWRDLGCYGSTSYDTPNLDRLASEGVRFTDAYASCPVCSPSRAALMTGKNPSRLGMTAHIGDAGPKHWKRNTPLLPANYLDHLPHDEQTLAEVLHDAGYATMHAGKWHLGGEAYWPEYHGFDVNAGGWGQGGPFGGKQYFSPYANPRLPDGPEGEHLPDRLASEVDRFIQSHRHEPFFVHLAWYSVHIPLVAPESLEAKYRERFEASGDEVGEMRVTIDGSERVRQDHATYAAMVESMDAAVGRVLESIKQAGVEEETIVIFTSDNGGLATGERGGWESQGWPTTNSPLRAGKGWLYEGGIRVPLIVRAPGLTPAGGESNRVVVGSDYYATLLELANISTPAGQAVDSESFVESLRALPEQRGPAIWHYPHYGNQGGRPGAAIRDGDWKLIEWYADTPANSDIELYNLADDLGEQNDLSAEHPERREAMLKQLRGWRGELQVAMPTPRTSPVARKRDSPRAAKILDEESARPR